MTPKERVFRGLEKKPVDRVPVFMWFHPETVRLLAEYFGMEKKDVGEIFGGDVKQTWVNNNYAMEGIVHSEDGETHTDFWGITWEKRHFFNQIKTHPLRDLPAEELLEYRFPRERTEEMLRPMEDVASSGEDFFIGCDVSPCAFEMYWRLRGMERALLDFYEFPSAAARMIEACVDFSIHLSEEALSRFPLDWLWTGDDVASQSTMILGPEMWRKTIKPHMKRLFGLAKEKGIYTAYHSCGAVRPIIPDLIEIGMDVLNPVQPNCPGMDPLELKKEFGEDIAFMGGLDTQYLLPKGTPEEVRREVRRLIDGMTADGGGYILAASHTIPPETPLENIFVLYEEAGIDREEILGRIEGLRRT